jgi:lipid-binding SYLF domain-containing protein
VAFSEGVILMSVSRWPYRPFLVLLGALVVALAGNQAVAGPAELNRSADAALANLYATVPAAKELSKKATAVLVFPNIIKAGFILGGEYGDGVLRKGGKTAGYYRTAGVSYGLQIGAQDFGYALFFMDPDALSYLDSSEGWQLGTGPSLVVMDEGMAKSFSTTTAQNGVYAFIFGQSGLMAGLGIQGSKITRIYP